MKKTISVTEYAQAYEISRQAVLKKIKLGRLPKGQKAKKIGNQWAITVPASDKF